MSSTEQVNRRMYVTSRKTTVTSSEYKVTDGEASSHEQKGRFCSPSTECKDSCWVSVLYKLLVCVICGMIFGIALHKAHGKWIYKQYLTRLIDHNHQLD